MAKERFELDVQPVGGGFNVWRADTVGEDPVRVWDMDTGDAAETVVNCTSPDHPGAGVPVPGKFYCEIDVRVFPALNEAQRKELAAELARVVHVVARFGEAEQPAAQTVPSSDPAPTSRPAKEPLKYWTEY